MVTQQDIFTILVFAVLVLMGGTVGIYKLVCHIRLRRSNSGTIIFTAADHSPPNSTYGALISTE